MKRGRGATVVRNLWHMGSYTGLLVYVIKGLCSVKTKGAAALVKDGWA